MTKLLIVESPAKCQKIAGFLGAGWQVKATMGHIRALKEELDAIGFNATAGSTQAWKPTYESLATKRDAIANLRKAAKGVEVYLGSDDDREGEAIAWHTCAILGLDPTTTKRVTFHEITESALKAAVQSPGRIDMRKFEAQQARTMLDMLIGFTLSPCLWRSVGYKPGLSAGRCQTPALRIIYDRDVAIESHQVSTSWRIQASSDLASSVPAQETTENLVWKGTEEYATEAEATEILQQLCKSVGDRTLTIRDRQERVATSRAPAPFITSSLQQEASSRLSMNPKTTMRIAQTLYEGGHITYMRTDSAILSQEAVDAATAVVRERWGEEYLDSTPVSSSETKGAAKKKVLKKKTQEVQGAPVVQAQAAHECIRPTHLELPEPDGLQGQELRLYTLIWKRTIQSIMAPETRDVVQLTSVPTPHPTLLTLTTSWDQTRFAGWRVLDTERKEEEEAAAAAVFAARKSLHVNQSIPWTVFTVSEQRSSAKSRYTEASLIRELETKGIGRPSTYATLVDTVLDRGYVEKATIPATTVELRGYELKATAKSPKAVTRKEKVGAESNKLRTTPLGRTVIEWLLAQFGTILDYEFTAAMEGQLDEVAKGARTWSSVLDTTWSAYAEKYTEIMKKAPTSSTSEGGQGPRPNKSDFGDGYKLVVSKKGPLFVLEQEGQPTRFAPVPASLSVQTATRADAEAAFAAAAAAETLGTLDGHPVIRKKGPYGHYVTWNSLKLNCQPTETLEELTPRLRAKATGEEIDHAVGAYKIKRGPYGLYMFRTGTKGKPTFVSIPDTTPWSTLTPESAEQVYKLASQTKKAKK